MWVSGVEINGMDLDARLGLKPWGVGWVGFFSKISNKNNLGKWIGGKVGRKHALY